MYFENVACANESMETKTKDCSLSMDVDHCDNTDENTNLLEDKYSYNLSIVDVIGIGLTVVVLF